MSGAPDSEKPERRPLATRKLGVSQWLAVKVAATGISPNAISTVGMVAGIAGGVVLAMTTRLPEQARGWWIAGAVLVQMRLLANMLDGMVAMETGKDSALGELFNEVPDRVSDVATLAGLGFAAGGDPVAGLAAACVSVFVAYVRAMGKAAGAVQDFGGPMAKPQRMFLVTLVALWCGLVPVEWRSLGGFGLPQWVLWMVIGGGLFTAVCRLWRIARALRDGGENHDELCDLLKWTPPPRNDCSDSAVPSTTR